MVSEEGLHRGNIRNICRTQATQNLVDPCPNQLDNVKMFSRQKYHGLKLECRAESFPIGHSKQSPKPPNLALRRTGLVREQCCKFIELVAGAVSQPPSWWHNTDVLFRLPLKASSPPTPPPILFHYNFAWREGLVAGSIRFLENIIFLNHDKILVIILRVLGHYREVLTWKNLSFGKIILAAEGKIEERTEVQTEWPVRRMIVTQVRGGGDVVVQRWRIVCGF